MKGGGFPDECRQRLKYARRPKQIRQLCETFVTLPGDRALFPHRQVNSEGAAFADVALNLQQAPVAVNDMLNNRQS